MIVLTFSLEELTNLVNKAVRDALSSPGRLKGAETPKYLTPVQLSELIGWKLSTVYQNHHNGLIPGASKVGNRLLFDSAIVLTWITENSIPTRAEKVKAYERRAK